MNVKMTWKVTFLTLFIVNDFVTTIQRTFANVLAAAGTREQSTTVVVGAAALSRKNTSRAKRQD